MESPVNRFFVLCLFSLVFRAVVFSTSFFHGGAGGGDVVDDHADMRGFDRKTMIRRELSPSTKGVLGLSSHLITLSRVLHSFPAPSRPPQKLHDLWRGPLVFLDPADRPDKPHQFPRHGGAGHGGALPTHHHSRKFLVEAKFRLSCRLDHRGGLSLPSFPDPLPRPPGGMGA